MEPSVETGSIERIEEIDTRGQANLILVGGLAFHIDTDHRMYDFWMKMLQTLRDDSARNNLTVLYDPLTRKVTALYPAVRRQIEGIGSAPKGERLDVYIYRSPSVYWIRTLSPSFAKLQSMIEAAAKRRAEALVAFDPETLEIVDCVISSP